MDKTIAIELPIEDVEAIIVVLEYYRDNVAEAARIEQLEKICTDLKEITKYRKTKLNEIKQDGVDEIEIYLADHQHLLTNSEQDHIRDYLTSNLKTLTDKYTHYLHNCNTMYELESFTWQSVIEQAVKNMPKN